MQAPYVFPDSFGYHSVDGKPWYISSPCWDFIENVQLEPGRHYVWDVHGFRMLSDCLGPPAELVSLASPGEQPGLAAGSCG